MATENLILKLEGLKARLYYLDDISLINETIERIEDLTKIAEYFRREAEKNGQLISSGNVLREN